MRTPVSLGLLIVLGCGGSDSTPTPTTPPPPISVTFTNRLYVPVTFSVGSVTYGTTAAGESKTIVFPGGTTTVTWTATDFTFSDGTPMVDDLASTSILVANLASLEVTAVVNGTSYVTPFITNQTGQSISFAVFDGSTVRCIGTQSANAQWGYYRVTSGVTQFRYYKSGTCSTGTYRYWDATTILNNRINSNTGLILLTADVAP
jgi:hypothetical protein